MKKQALGKGIRAFIPEEYGILKGERYAEMDIELIKPSAFQPRLKFDESAIGELAQSIKNTGVLQPIVVVPEGGQYRIIVGERRWRAAQKAGLKRIPTIIRAIPKEQELEVSLVENLQREELNPLEIANAYQRLVRELELTQQDVADKVGKDRTSVTNYLRLLKLPPEVQDKLSADKISMGHARALLGLENAELQVSLTRQIIDKQLSVREAERLIQKLRNRRPARTKKPADADLETVQEDLLKILGTKVVLAGSKNKGVIKIFYFSLDELNKLYGHIKGVRR
jgi:ParB family chromosome partitioning protein